jgi:hypothetical protein
MDRRGKKQGILSGISAPVKNRAEMQLDRHGDRKRLLRQA